MEIPEKKSSITNKLYRLVLWIALIVTGYFLVAVFIILGSQTGSFESLGIGGVLQIIHSNGWFLGLFFFLFIIGQILIKNRRDTFSKLMLWLVMIFGMFDVANMINNFASIASYDFANAFLIIAGYVPVICCTVSLVSLIVQWDSSDKTVTNMIAMVASVAAVFMGVFYLVRSVSLDSTNMANSVVQVLWVVVSQIVPMLICLCVYFLSLSRRMFDKSIYALSDEEARIAEEVEDRVELMVADMGEDLMKDAAIESGNEELSGATEETVEETEKLSKQTGEK